MSRRRIRTVVAVAVLAAPAALWAAKPGALHPATIAPDSAYASTATLLERVIAREMREQAIPALSIALVDGDRIVWARGFGTTDSLHRDSATAETVYRAATLSSLITALGVTQLAGEHRLDLDAPVTRYVASFHPSNAFGAPVTLRHLISQRSGLVREPPVGSVFDTSAASLDSTVSSLNATALVFAPGARAKYSNAGSAVAGLALERAVHEPFATFMSERVLAPLGMRESAFELSAALAPRLAGGTNWSYDGRRTAAPAVAIGESPAFSLYTTVTDLARLESAAFAGRAKLSVGQGLVADTVAGARELRQGGEGAGYSSELAMLPAERVGAVVMMSLDGSRGVARRIAATALRAMLAERRHAAMPRWDSTAAIPPARASKLAGHYARAGDGSARDAIDLVYLSAPSDSDSTAAQLDMRAESGGSRGVLRQRGDTLVRDDRFDYGLRLLPRGDTLIAGGARYVRRALARPAPLRAALARLVGEYGPDHQIFYILEERGRIEALANWFYQSPLIRRTDSTFVFPSGSPFDSEPVRFSFSDSGTVTGVRVGGTWLPRRAIGPASGNQLRVTPVRPIADLEREARAATPPAEPQHHRAADLVELVSLDSTIHLEIRYATTNNFLGTRFYPAPRAFLERPAAEALVRAHQKLKTLGYGILVHDSYRPWYVTKMFWDAVPEDKKIFVADPSQGSRHNRGAAADVTLYDLASGKPVDMVSTYDETSDRAWANYPGGTSLERWQRALLRHALEAEGFTVYHAEWWHFDYRGFNEYPILNIPFSDIHSTPSP